MGFNFLFPLKNSVKFVLELRQELLGTKLNFYFLDWTCKLGKTDSKHDLGDI